MTREIWLIRHGETEWSLSGAHTGRTDIPLTPKGYERAAAIGRQMAGRQFALVLSSPLLRARETCRMAGYGEAAQIDGDLKEWDYGSYEGRTTSEIQHDRPGWSIWKDGPLGGESIADVAARADRVIARVMAGQGDAALFAHGHVLRILAARWICFEPTAASRLALDTATISVLGYERDTQVIRSWNLSASA
jgi:probable phosphoglycerate mutase